VSTSSTYQRFLAELKRRHAFRIVAVYGVVDALQRGSSSGLPATPRASSYPHLHG